MSKITCDELVIWQKQKQFTLLDIRSSDVRAAQPASIAGSEWRDPQLFETWLTSVPSDRPVVVFCANDQAISKRIATKLDEAGLTAFYLEGGLAAWMDGGYLIIAE